MATVLRRLMDSAGWKNKVSSGGASNFRETGANPQLDDRIDYDSWLLPPLPLTRDERLIRRISTAAGPLALVAVAGFLLWLLFA